jgi:hypothetical protein
LPSIIHRGRAFSDGFSQGNPPSVFFYEGLLEKEQLSEMNVAQSSGGLPRQVFSPRNIGAQTTQ